IRYALTQSKASGGVEREYPSRVGSDAERRAHAGRRSMRDSRDDRVTAVTDVHQCIGTQLLDHFNRPGNDSVHVAAGREVLGPNTYRYRAAAFEDSAGIAYFTAMLE